MATGRRPDIISVFTIGVIQSSGDSRQATSSDPAPPPVNDSFTLRKLSPGTAAQATKLLQTTTALQPDSKTPITPCAYGDFSMRELAVKSISISYQDVDSAIEVLSAWVYTNNEAIDEIVVVGVNPCGSWPIEHDGLQGCEYAELRKEDLPMVLRSRKKFFSDCLKCLDRRCTMNAWPEDKTTEKLLCNRLFRTPTRIPRFMKSAALFSPFRVSFTFSISVKGKVEDVELVSFVGDYGEEELLRLIVSGASRTRFEPIVVADVAYQLVGLRDSVDTG